MIKFNEVLQLLTNKMKYNKFCFISSVVIYIIFNISTATLKINFSHKHGKAYESQRVLCMSMRFLIS